MSILIPTVIGASVDYAQNWICLKRQTSSGVFSLKTLAKHDLKFDEYMCSIFNCQPLKCVIALLVIHALTQMVIMETMGTKQAIVGFVSVLRVFCWQFDVLLKFSLIVLFSM